MDAAWQVHNHFPWKLSIYVLAGLDQSWPEKLESVDMRLSEWSSELPH